MRITKVKPTSLEINGEPYDIKTANRPYSFAVISPHQLRMEVRPGDGVFASDIAKGADRSEVNMSVHISQRHTVEIVYDIRIEPGPTPIHPWTLISQWHAKDKDIDDDGDKDGTAPPVHVSLSPGDRLTFVGRSGVPVPDISLPIVCSYTTPDAISRNVWHTIRLKTRFLRSNRGRFNAWLNGAKVLDYSGPLGYDTVNRWKFGVYRKTQPFPLAVRFRAMDFDLS